jgi:hypothetical protein
MKTCVLLNHDLTPGQREELGGEILELPPELKPIWAQVPPETDYAGVRAHLDPVYEWLWRENPGQIVCQGDFTAFAVVIQAGWQVLVATSRRESVEENGIKKSIFKHVRFRRVTI